MLAIAVGTALALGLGDDDEADRKAVAEYIAAVNRVEQRHARELTAATTAYGKLDLSASPPPRQARDLARAETAMADVRREMARLTPPTEAATLHRKLMRMLDAQVAFARDADALVRGMSALAREERRFLSATTRLRRDLARATDAAATDEPFARYASALATAERRVRSLELPAALEPSQRARASKLRRLAKFARRVVSALRTKSGGEAGYASRSLARIAGAPSDAAAERTAVTREYNRRLGALGALQRAVQRERDRLDATL